MNLLIDDVVILDHNVTTIMHELESVSVGVTAMRRLEKINSTVHELRVGGCSKTILLSSRTREASMLLFHLVTRALCTCIVDYKPLKFANERSIIRAPSLD